ncbi:Anaphase-promoting complex subunit 5 [Sphaceloma murrayae]|uniref:Anaphase-promoting complex subunit 5 n=1 Tax=Sphaceloma murrayae TaxID=2082308 RepID=A0A2K1QXP8_9PEZI|nr:Anaphase-promoting complex subunit 5 [Sphaceloma murrayae]
MSGHQQSAPPRTGAPSSFSFVTATNPQQFRERGTMRQVRQQVMYSYLNKAEQDPTTTDKRVTKKRPSRATRTPSSQQAAGSAQNPAVTSSTAIPIDVPSDDLLFARFEPSEAYATPDGSSASSLAAQSFPPYTTTTIGFSDPTITSLVAHISSPMNYAQQPDIDEFSYSDTALVSKRNRSREQNLYDVAYGNPYGLHIDCIMPDPFASFDQLGNNRINVELLKSNCSAYFGSKALLDVWVHFLTSSPSAFLASLCIAAPYTDLMAQSNTSMSTIATVPNQRQTMELLTEVPKIVNESLHDPAEGFSDINVVAVCQLLAGQLTSDYTWIVPAHRYYMKHMVNTRGGLDKLGGEQVIAFNCCLTDFEAAMLANEPLDTLYLNYAREYIDTHPYVKFPAPESPIFVRDGDMRSIASNRTCSRQTLNLIILMNHLTETCIQLNRLEGRKASPTGPMPAELPDADALQLGISDIATKVHAMQPANIPGHAGFNDAYYEAIRLASIIYTHAILHRMPFHEALHVRCSLSSSAIGHTPSCAVTPAQIQQVIQRTNISDAWERMGGSLYWTLMVAAAAYHEPKGSAPTGGRKSPRKDSVQSSQPGQSTSYPTRSRGLLRSESAPTTQRVSQPSHTTTTMPPTSRSASATVDWAQAFNFDQRITDVAMTNAPSAPSAWSEVPLNNSTRIFHQYLSSEHNTPGTSATPSLTGSSSHPHTPSPPLLPIRVVSTHPTTTQELAVPTTFPTSSQSVSTPPSHPTPSTSTMTSASTELQQFKRPRTSTASASSIAAMKASKDKELGNFKKRYLIANAVRTSILLRFEHTTAILSAAIKLGEVQDYLNRRTTLGRTGNVRT